MVVKLGLLH